MSGIVIKSHKGVDCWNRIGVWSFSTQKCEKLEEYVHCRNCPTFSHAGHLVFEKTSPSGYLSQWRKEISQLTKADNSIKNSILVFRVGLEWLSFPTNILSEVANAKPVHRIPRNMNRYITGIVNINGEVNICYSLRELLGLSDSSDNNTDNANRKPKRLLVIEIESNNYVFLVDEVRGIIWHGDSDIVPVPSTLSCEDALLLRGSVKQQDKQIVIFDVNKLKDRLEGVPL